MVSAGVDYSDNRGERGREGGREGGRGRGGRERKRERRDTNCTHKLGHLDSLK